MRDARAASVVLEGEPDDNALMFELAPVSLWLEDFSGVRRLFDEWRAAGIGDLQAYLREDTERVRCCVERIRVVKVNRRTLTLFEASSQDHLVDNLNRVFRDDMLDLHIHELAQLWVGRGEFYSNTVNYTLTGQRLDIQLHATILPGHEADWGRVLVAIEDVSEREAAGRELRASHAYARGLFEHSPISLWVEDFSAVKTLIEEVRTCGISDFRTFTDVHPEFVQRCISEIRVLDVNNSTLEVFGAASKADLMLRQYEIFRDAMQQPFREQLVDLWDGKLFQTREVVNYSLSGEELYFLMQFSVFPGHEADWSLVLVALTDITARKKAESYLEFLGKHDVLTKLFNRSFYIDEIARLERARLAPTTIIMADLNGLKATNDSLGHAAGDQLLRRAGEVLGTAVEKPAHACRIGGDEFAILLPATDARGGQAMVENILKLVDLNNQFYSGRLLSFAIGIATAHPGERLEEVAKRADARMYEAKRAYYAEGAAPDSPGGAEPS
jgi:diguanylate cyclase (GGDEF)-like protein